MRRRAFVTLAGASAIAAALPRAAIGQPAQRLPRVVFLGAGVTTTQISSVREGLADHGYVEGRNVVFEVVNAPTIAEIPRFAAQVVASRPDLIVTQGSPTPLALKGLTSTIPIVLGGLQDPVPIGLVSSYARPSGNITGLMQASRDLIPKQIEVIREIVPQLTRLALFALPADSNYPFERDQTTEATKSVGIETIVFDAAERVSLEPLLARAVEQGCQAARFVNVQYFNGIAPTLAELALKYRLPSIGRETHARAGILIGYFGSGYNGDPTLNSYRRAGYYVDLILKGAKAGDIPVEGPTNFDFVVNLKTAKALGITIPPTVLFQATEVIS
jgi:putative ABC transport system substrate-binding protein